MARQATWVVLASIVLVQAVSLGAAQDAGPTDPGTDCGGTGFPCWVVGVLGLTILLFVATLLRTAILARKIRHGPPVDDDVRVPPDLRAGPQDAAPPSPPQATFPARHTPWPEQASAEPGAVRRPDPRDEPGSEQVSWGDHRLWFDNDGGYVFSVHMDVPDDWLPCFRIPKGHRIEVGADGKPRLERFDPRHP